MKTPHRRGLYAPELLEARIAPASFIVSTLGNTGDGSLRKAVADAEGHAGADTIVFKIPAAMLPGVITLTTGEIAITQPLTIKGPGIDLLSVSGNDASRIFKIDDGTAALQPTTISGLTLTNGKAADYGGAIYSKEPLTLSNVVIRNSSTGNRGGGAFVQTDGKISVVHSAVVHNMAVLGNGGGGGLYLNGAAGVSIVKTTIADNMSLKNAGLYAIARGAKAVIVIDSCVIANNASSGVAGGIRLGGADDGKILIKNTLITGNTSNDAGGGLYLRSGNLVLANTTVANNSGAFGGGLAAGASKSVTISGSRFLGNRATATAAAAVSGGGRAFFRGSSHHWTRHRGHDRRQPLCAQFDERRRWRPFPHR